MSAKDRAVPGDKQSPRTAREQSRLPILTSGTFKRPNRAGGSTTVGTSRNVQPQEEGNRSRELSSLRVPVTRQAKVNELHHGKIQAQDKIAANIEWHSVYELASKPQEMHPVYTVHQNVMECGKIGIDQTLSIPCIRIHHCEDSIKELIEAHSQQNSATKLHHLIKVMTEREQATKEKTTELNIMQAKVKEWEESKKKVAGVWETFKDRKIKQITVKTELSTANQDKVIIRSSHHTVGESGSIHNLGVNRRGSPHKIYDSDEEPCEQEEGCYTNSLITSRKNLFTVKSEGSNNHHVLKEQKSIQKFSLGEVNSNDNLSPIEEMDESIEARKMIQNTSTEKYPCATQYRPKHNRTKSLKEAKLSPEKQMSDLHQKSDVLSTESSPSINTQSSSGKTQKRACPSPASVCVFTENCLNNLSDVANAFVRIASQHVANKKQGEYKYISMSDDVAVRSCKQNHDFKRKENQLAKVGRETTWKKCVISVNNKKSSQNFTETCTCLCDDLSFENNSSDSISASCSEETDVTMDLSAKNIVHKDRQYGTIDTTASRIVSPHSHAKVIQHNNSSERLLGYRPLVNAEPSDDMWINNGPNGPIPTGYDPHQLAELRQRTNADNWRYKMTKWMQEMDNFYHHGADEDASSTNSTNPSTDCKKCSLRGQVITILYKHSKNCPKYHKSKNIGQNNGTMSGSCSTASKLSNHEQDINVEKKKEDNCRKCQLLHDKHKFRAAFTRHAEDCPRRKHVPINTVITEVVNSVLDLKQNDAINYTKIPSDAVIRSITSNTDTRTPAPHTIAAPNPPVQNPVNDIRLNAFLELTKKLVKRDEIEAKLFRASPIQHSLSASHTKPGRPLKFVNGPPWTQSLSKTQYKSKQQRGFKFTESERKFLNM